MYVYFIERDSDINDKEDRRKRYEIYDYYSSFCDANWAEVTMYQDPGRSVSIDIYTTDANGHYEKQCELTNCSDSYNGTSYPAWTNMIDGTNLTTACALVSNADGEQGDCVSQ